MDFLFKRRLSHYLRLEYPVRVVITGRGVCGSFPDLPGCTVEAATMATLHRELFLARRRWLEQRISRGKRVPLPNMHLHAKSESDELATPSPLAQAS